jgi:hypothetical protein
MPLFPNVLAIVPVALLTVTVSQAVAQPPVVTAGRDAAPNNEMNPWWRDYQTDLSEARRELASDLRRANDPGDRQDAYAEYEREVVDARHDYQKEMVERGYAVGSVTFEPSE